MDKIGQKYRKLKSKEQSRKSILDNEYVAYIDDFLKNNYNNTINGKVEILLDIPFENLGQVGGYATNEDLVTLEKYIKMYLKYHDIYFDSFDFYYDKEDQTPYYKLTIDLDYPYDGY